MLECDYADIDLREIIDTRLFDFGKVATSAAWVQELEGHPEENTAMEMNAMTGITTIMARERRRNTAYRLLSITVAVR